MAEASTDPDPNVVRALRDRYTDLSNGAGPTPGVSVRHQQESTRGESWDV